MASSTGSSRRRRISTADRIFARLGRLPVKLMNKNALLLLSVLSVASLAAPACTITTTANRDVGSLNADGSVYLGWHLLNRDNKSGNDRETYDVGAQLGAFSSIRLHGDKPIAIAQVLVIFANGEQWVAPAPAGLANDEWSQPIPLPGGPRPIHSIVVYGRSTASALSKLEIHGGR